MWDASLLLFHPLVGGLVSGLTSWWLLVNIAVQVLLWSRCLSPCCHSVADVVQVLSWCYSVVMSMALPECNILLDPMQPRFR